ncbi:MAG: hypothetical protein OXE78_02975 [Gammaproteobacteria bacterium]|nr:hypothetical protein [Gammaproteobacteria bacterium]MCY4357870.1 hypothetical protein [Gammaproteobacteria bacterium]
MKIFYCLVAISIVATALTVWFVPGVDDQIEQIIQSYVGRAAS